MHGFQLPHLLMDLVVLLNELLLDEDDVLFFQQRLDLAQTHAKISHVPDDVQPRRLADVVISVVGRLVSVAWLQQTHLVIESERGNGDTVRLCHFADGQQVFSLIVIHSCLSFRWISNTKWT